MAEAQDSASELLASSRLRALETDSEAREHVERIRALAEEREQKRRQVQKLACEAVRLQSVDMIGVATSDRPLEQVADFCPFGWGGIVYQLSPNQKNLNVLGMYGGSLSLAQSNWHPRRGELYAQRETRREARKHLGRLPAICWTDHSASVKGATGEAEVDPSIIR